MALLYSLETFSLSAQYIHTFGMPRCTSSNLRTCHAPLSGPLERWLQFRNDVHEACGKTAADINKLER